VTLSRTALSFFAGAVLAAGATGGWLVRGAQATESKPATATVPIAPLSGPPNYRAIVAENSPAVVGITVDGEVRQARNDEPDAFGDDPFFRFFRGIPRGRSRVPMHGQGSGFIVTADGMVLTNAHVVRDAQRVTVKLPDHREFRAKVLGSDTSTDIAVLKIDAKKLPTVTLGDTAKLAVGDYVLAIGEPFGFEASATAGIVSAKGRSLPGESSVPFIQTDVAVNPGNSGGPLFDAGGRVVGINSQIYSNTGGYQGLSFAIPIEVALRVKDEIVAHGKVEHARLGVLVQPVNQALAESFGLDKPDGALVSKVTPDSAAERAGLQPGDVILKYNGETIDGSGDLSAHVGMAKPGDTVELEVWRDGKTRSVTARLGADTEVAAAGDAAAGGATHGKLGLSVRSLTPEERQEAGVQGGVVVEDVAEGPAEDAGLRPGDIVLSVNGKPVRSAEDLKKAATGQGKEIALLIQRGDARIFVPLSPG